jgi:hypothetical protein
MVFTHKDKTAVVVPRQLDNSLKYLKMVRPVEDFNTKIHKGFHRRTSSSLK